MTTPHPDADKLRAIADGKQMQVYGVGGSPWVDATPDHALFAVYNGEQCRIKPEVVLINGVECEAFQRDKSSFSVCITLVGNNELIAEGVFYWPGKMQARDAFDALIKPFRKCQE